MQVGEGVQHRLPILFAGVGQQLKIAIFLFV